MSKITMVDVLCAIIVLVFIGLFGPFILIAGLLVLSTSIELWGYVFQAVGLL